ncbi:hypothetical protein F4859DRAFT_528779 [Xylaria cf. heliscus]|nr:hypothetical protein F4859DRAFT_528779 [Xylaria cf. heliscus]
MAGTGFGPPSNPPSSPWAKRFPGLESTFMVENTSHSLLAPQFPRINDPKYYDEHPDQNSDYRPQNYVETDNLFWSEKVQREILFGIQTWQVAALNCHLSLPSSTGDGLMFGGHRRPDKTEIGMLDRIMAKLPLLNISGSSSRPSPRKPAPSTSSHEERDFLAYQRERIKVDEAQWFPFLRKDRWFDWIQFSTDNTQSRPDRTWSVDDPKVWGALNLRTILYGRIDYWSNFIDIFGTPPSKDASVLLSHSMELNICNVRGTNVCQWEQTVTHTVAQSNDRLVDLLSTLVWSFDEHDGAHAVTMPIPVVGRDRRPYSSAITIDVWALEAILDPDLVVGELCVRQVNLAITYLDGEGFAEAGYYMEQSFFGGEHKLHPLLPMRPDPPPLVQVFMKWPHAHVDPTYKPADPKSAFLKDDAFTTIYHVPSTWYSKFLAEYFWESPLFLRKSDHFFHRSRMFVTRGRILDRRIVEWQKPRVIRGRKAAPDNYPENEVAIEDWNFRNALWDGFRTPWYDRYNKDWESSPWSDIDERQRFNLFADAFARKDHIKCANLATYFIQQVDWDKNHSTYRSYMPSKVEASSEWIWHAIGLLMMASIPLRPIRLTQKKGGTEWRRELTPSREAAAAGHSSTMYSLRNSDPEEISASSSRLYNYTKPRGRRINNFTQLGYLDLIDDMIELIIRLDAVIHIQFLQAINAAKDALRADRQQLDSYYPGASHTKWASEWFFKLPEYDPAISSFVGGQWFFCRLRHTAPLPSDKPQKWADGLRFLLWCLLRCAQSGPVSVAFGYRVMPTETEWGEMYGHHLEKVKTGSTWPWNVPQHAIGGDHGDQPPGLDDRPVRAIRNLASACSILLPNLEEEPRLDGLDSLD